LKSNHRQHYKQISLTFTQENMEVEKKTTMVTLTGNINIPYGKLFCFFYLMMFW